MNEQGNTVKKLQLAWSASMVLHVTHHKLMHACIFVSRVCVPYTYAQCHACYIVTGIFLTVPRVLHVCA